VLAGTLVPTPAPATLDPEVWDTLRRQFFRLAQQVVQQYAGTIQQIGDDDFLALFGALMAQEDHAQRAVLAALSLQRAVRHPGTDLAGVPGVDLAVQLGVHTGQVMVGPLVDSYPLLALTVGDTLRVAVRLRHLATSGTLLLSATTRPRVHGVVYGATVTQDPGAGPETLLAYEVQHVTPQTFHWPHGRALSPFVGRDRELAMLQAVLAQVEAGHGHVVGLVGDPGMGKSRLLYEFQHQVVARSLTMLVGSCVSYSQATPYLPLRDYLRQAWAIAETDTPAVLTTTVVARLQHLALAPETWGPPLLALLGAEPETDQWTALSAPQRRAQTFEALLHVSLHTSRQRPLVLAIENLHWIDPTSEAWLGLLTERLAGVPLLLLTTTRPGYRPPWLDKSYALQLALPRLTAPESWRVVQARRLTAPVPEPLLQTIIARAEGNPFFLEELVGAVAEQNAAHPGAIPETIQAVLATRLDRLSPAAKQVAQVAAVLGKEVAAPLLQAVCILPEAAQRRSLLELQAAEMLYEIPGVLALTYTFKHALLQEVTYSSLLTRARQQIHLHVAQVLSARFPEIAETQPELLAQHYTAAGRAAEAVTYWQRAGQRANERAAYVEALAHLTRGLDVLTTLPDTAERVQHELLLQVTLSASLVATKGYIAPEVKRTYDRALALCRHVGESSQFFPAVFGLFRFALVRGELSVAHELAEHLVLLAQRAADPLLLVGAHAAFGATLWHRGELTASLTQLEQGIAVSKRQQHRVLLLQYGEDLGVVCLGVAALGLHLLGYPAQALARSRACVARAHEASHPFLLAQALVGSCMFHQMRREGARVREQVQTAMTLLTAHGLSPEWLALATMLLGWALAVLGQATEGLAQLCQGLDRYRSLGGELRLPWFLALLAEAYGQAGQREEGLRVLADARTLVDKTSERVYEAELYRLQGQLTLAPSHVQGPASSSTQPHATSLTAHAEAESCFLKAMEIARQQQAKTLELRAALSLARLWQQQGKHTAARALLAPLYGWFTEGFDTVDLQEAKVLLDTLGE
jgi:predicted ATPase